MKDCTVTNKTFTAIFVECKPGYDGGLQQSFIIEVFPVSAMGAVVNKATASSGGQSSRPQVEVVIEADENDDDVFEGSPKASLTSPIARLENRHFPQFSVEGLAPGKAFGMVVYAQNTKVDINLIKHCENKFT